MPELQPLVIEGTPKKSPEKFVYSTAKIFCTYYEENFFPQVVENNSLRIASCEQYCDFENMVQEVKSIGCLIIFLNSNPGTRELFRATILTALRVIKFPRRIFFVES
jgi:hypothetical protein